MIKKIISDFDRMESSYKFIVDWGVNFEEYILRINEYFRNRNVFVYGDFMFDEANHSYLCNSTYLRTCYISGYDVLCYLAIIPGADMVVGELYQVPEEDIESIDILEGEGSLYLEM